MILSLAGRIYAELGRPGEAARATEAALALAQQRGDAGFAAELRERATAYRAQSPRR